MSGDIIKIFTPLKKRSELPCNNMKFDVKRMLWIVYLFGLLIGIPSVFVLLMWLPAGQALCIGLGSALLLGVVASPIIKFIMCRMEKDWERSLQKVTKLAAESEKDVEIERTQIPVFSLELTSVMDSEAGLMVAGVLTGDRPNIGDHVEIAGKCEGLRGRVLDITSFEDSMRSAVSSGAEFVISRTNSMMCRYALVIDGLSSIDVRPGDTIRSVSRMSRKLETKSLTEEFCKEIYEYYQACYNREYASARNRVLHNVQVYPGQNPYIVGHAALLQEHDSMIGYAKSSAETQTLGKYEITMQQLQSIIKLHKP